MNYVRAVIVAWSLSGAFLFGAPADSLTNELPRLQGVYATAVAAIDVKYQAMLTNAPTQYLQGLDALEKIYQQKGEFKSVMAVRAERERVKPEAFAPGPDSDTDPKELKEYRAKARPLPAQFSEQKAKELEALASAYLTRLEALQRDLTKTGRITVAAEVQVEMDRIKPALNSLRDKVDAPVSAVPPDGEIPAGSRLVTSMASLGSSKRITEDGLFALLDKSRNKTGAKPLARIIANDTTLSGRYYAANGLMIEKAATLTLEPQSVIVMPKGSNIRVEGFLKAQGEIGNWAVICGETKGDSIWDGIYFPHREGGGTKVINLNGLVIANAITGLDIDAGPGRPSRIYTISDSIFIDNAIGVVVGRDGSGQGPVGVTKNCLFIKNVKIGFQMANFYVNDQTLGLRNCSFVKNGIGLKTGGGGAGYFFGSQVTLADQCLFLENDTGVKGGNKEAVVTRCMFERNALHFSLPNESAVADAPENYWGPVITRLLDASEGANSGQTISRTVNTKGWLKQPPENIVGADFISISGYQTRQPLNSIKRFDTATANDKIGESPLATNTFLATDLSQKYPSNNVTKIRFKSDSKSSSIIDDAIYPTGTKTKEGVVLTQGSLSSSKNFKPPVKITYIARTDSTNIRLGYAAKEIIFNWEINKNTLYVGGGPANGQNRPGKGAIPINEFVTIEQEVRPDKMIIRVDGKERASWDANFSNINEPVRIFTAQGAMMTVKDILVE